VDQDAVSPHGTLNENKKLQNDSFFNKALDLKKFMNTKIIIFRGWVFLYHGSVVHVKYEINFHGKNV
jgi:hypothetical protein